LKSLALASFPMENGGVHPIDDHAFRELMDERGIARPLAVYDAPVLSHAYSVFGQAASVRFDVDSWDRNATRFFGTKLGLTIEKRYDGAPLPNADIARVVIAEQGEPAAVRTVYARLTTDADLAAALSAERIAKTTGLHLLARRCPTIWIIETETIDAVVDRPALLVAAILSSNLLGPILAPDAQSIFGVRTARIDLEKFKSPGSKSPSR
jgi:hypothetical protein